MDEARETAGQRLTTAADIVEDKSSGAWTPLEEGDLVLLRRFDVEKHHGMKLESQWEGPYRLSDLAYHGKSGRLRDMHTGDLVKVRKGGLWERVHVNDLKLFCPRRDRPAADNGAVEIGEEGGGTRDFCLEDGAVLMGS